MLITGTTKLSLETFHATTDIPPPIFATLIFVDRPMEMQVGPIAVPMVNAVQDVPDDDEV